MFACLLLFLVCLLSVFAFKGECLKGQEQRKRNKTVFQLTRPSNVGAPWLVAVLVPSETQAVAT